MMNRKGFTLLEMMIVIGIVAILGGVMISSFGKYINSAKRQKVQELVSNTATSLTHILQSEGQWPMELLKADEGVYGGKLLNEKAALAFVKNNRKLMGLNYKSGKLQGVDRCGIVVPEGTDLLKRTTKTPSGDAISHLTLHFAIDTESEGLVAAEVPKNVTKGQGGKPSCELQTVEVRAAAIVWAVVNLGGKPECIQSWRPSQEVKK